jgi:hypothetical protein
MNAQLSLAFTHVGMARAGPYCSGGGGPGLPASAATEPIGGVGVLPYLPSD